MEINGGGVAYAVGLYAQDQGGRNGVPVRDDRTRHVLDEFMTAAKLRAGCGWWSRRRCWRRCSSSPSPAAISARELAGKVSVDGMYAHLGKLQEIADANKRTRADGTPGYDASLDYVAATLRDKGFDVQTPEFERLAHDTRAVTRH